MKGIRMFNDKWLHGVRHITGLLLVAILLAFLIGKPITPVAAQQLADDNQIILPADGQVVVNFISTSASCTGDFGLYFPETISIYPDYLYYQGLPFSLPNYFSKDTELVFSLSPRDFCTGGPYLSTDPNRAQITQPDPNTWIIAWEDYNDGDFNDLIVQVNFQTAIIPFLDLPFDYTDSTFFDESRDTEQGGKVNTYFDHQYPTYGSAPNAGHSNVVNFFGYDSSQTDPLPPYHVVYDGHDGIDYLINQGTPVLAAASGTVSFAGEITVKCSDGISRTANVVKITHADGYSTEYWHLDSFEPGIGQGAAVTRDTEHPIGYVGNTGCSTGPHLHFLARNPAGKVVDPYGWMPLPDAAWYGEADPWQHYNDDHGGVDATSHYLWVHPLVTTMLFSLSAPTVITSTSGSTVATLPVGVYQAPLRLQMVEGLQSARISQQRSLYTFSLYGYTTNNVPVTSLSGEIGIDVEVSSHGLKMLSASDIVTPTLRVWDAQSSTWQALPTIWDPLTQHASATSSQIGAFALTIPEYRVYLPLTSRNQP